MVAYDAFWGGVAIPVVIVLGLMAIPYFDRNPQGEGVLVSSEPLFGSISLYGIYDMARDIDSDWSFFRGANWGWIWPWTETFARH